MFISILSILHSKGSLFEETCNLLLVHDGSTQKCQLGFLHRSVDGLQVLQQERDQSSSGTRCQPTASTSISSSAKPGTTKLVRKLWKQHPLLLGPLLLFSQQG